MLSYCLKCRECTESKNPKGVRTKNGRIMVSSHCTICNVQEASGLLSSLGIKKLLSLISFVGSLVLKVLIS